LLRRALHAAAESAELAGDGLERIRARLAPKISAEIDDAGQQPTAGDTLPPAPSVAPETLMQHH
jgi:hypothetical protein